MKACWGAWVVSGALLLHSPDIGAVTCNILDFGALSGGADLSTSAINAAIAKCSADGGGRVLIPAGVFVSGTIFLKDNVDLHLEAGATLFASTDRRDFVDLPDPAPPLLRTPGWSALVFAENARNISISGSGVIDGRGKGKSNEVVENGRVKNRVKNLLFVSCRDVSVSGVSLNNSNHWNQHYLDCEDVTIDRIKVYNHVNGNNDGIDIDGCRRVVVSNCIVDSDDDGIVLKSTSTVPCDDVVIANCIVSSHANAIKCGTESLGGFRNIAISNCVIRPSRSEERKEFSAARHGISGISLIVVDGGVMEGVAIDNVVIQGTETPLYIRLGNRERKENGSSLPTAVGAIRNVQISNITAYSTGNYSASVTGIPGGKIESVFLNNLRFSNKGGLGLSDASQPAATSPGDLRHDFGGGPPNGKFIANYSMVVEDAGGYPQPTVWRNLPSFGFFLRHVKSIHIGNASLQSESNDPRIPIIAVDVDQLQLKDIDLPGGAPVDVLLKDVGRSIIDASLSIHTEK